MLQNLSDRDTTMYMSVKLSMLFQALDYLLSI